MPFPSMRLDDKIALITGAGTGLGQAMALGFAEMGADVAITELPGKEALAEKTAEGIRATGRRALVVPLDVTQTETIAPAVAKVLDEFGRIDILVNNAGINIPKYALDVTENDWDRIQDVNLKGTFFVAQAVAKQALVPQGGGKIVNIASQMGVIGYSKRAAYCASKAGVVNLTRVLAFEWAQYSINVNCIGPTFVLTPLTAPMFEDPEFREDVLRRIPLGRLGEPGDIVGAAVYLASPAADMVTGHALIVDGGWTAV